MSLHPRAVVVHRRTEYEELTSRHGTRQQAAFFLRERGRSLDEVASVSDQIHAARRLVGAAIPATWRRAEIERSDLDRFVFGPEDVVVVVGQDGLVANTAKYLAGQPVIGIDPQPGHNPGVLVTHPPEAARSLLLAAAENPRLQPRSMVQARTDQGHVLRALNEVYIGHASHQSARYQLMLQHGAQERQSSSGVLVGTGTGATGWLRSAWQERDSHLSLPGPTERTLCWFVREAWPSPTTGTGLTQGELGADEALTVIAESDQLVCFGDGIEGDALTLTWGQRVTITTAPQVLNLVI